MSGFCDKDISDIVLSIVESLLEKGTDENCLLEFYH